MRNEQDHENPEELSEPESSSDRDSSQQSDEESTGKPKESNNSLEVASIPQNAIVFRQAHFSWLIPSSIWIIALVFIDVQMGLLGGFGILLAPLIAAPRYLRWRQTVYHLSDDSLYLTMAGLPIIQKSKIYRVAFNTMIDMSVRHGIFGKTLGYGEINIVFDDKRVARLSYISAYQSFIEHISSKTELPGTELDQPSSEQ